MYNCQLALITHLKRQFTAPAVYTVKEYSGELANADQVSDILPAILTIFIDGRPMAQEAEHEFDLLIITENRALVAEDASNENLELSSQVAAYLQEHYIFAANGRAGTYEIAREQTRARTILNDARFCIIAISLLIKDWTH